MPGHKGISFLGFESLDITEIEGADVLYSANGIIEESQNIASELFGTGATLYSCEGSSLSITAMLYLAVLTSNMPTKTILAGRNAHKAFMNSAAMLDFETDADAMANELLMEGKDSVVRFELAVREEAEEEEDGI